MANVGGVLPAPPNKPMSEKAKTQIVLAIISGLVSISVALIGTFVALRSSGSQISNLNQQAQNIKQTIDYIATPPGTIAAYGGPLDQQALEKQGWLPCDGKEVSRKLYSALFEKVGASWGSGDGVNTFNLPDLRGVFLRGVNGDRKEQFGDPEASQRISLTDGGNAKNKVGSYQPDEVGGHVHSFSDGQPSGSAKHNEKPRDLYSKGDKDGIFSVDELRKTVSNGGVETRPKNAYVYYVIKY